MTTSFNRRTLLAATGAGASLLFAGRGFAQSAANLPPAPKPDAWIKSPTIRFPAISPDGMNVAYLSEEGGVKYLVSFDVAANKAAKINIGTTTVEDLSWIDDSHVLVITTIPARRASSDTGPGRLTIAVVYNLKAGSLFRLFDKVPKFAGIADGDFNIIKKDGKVQITASGQRDDQDGFTYLYAFDTDGNNYDMLDRGPRETVEWILGADGTLVGRISYYGASYEWVVDYHNGNAWKEIYREKIARYMPDVYGLSADGKSLLIKTYGDEETGTYRLLAPDGTLSEPLVADSSGRFPIINPYTRRLLGFTHNVGWPQYEFTDTAMKTIAVKAQAAMEGYRMEIAGYAEDPNKVIVLSEGDDDAGTYYYINFASGMSFPVGSIYPDIPPAWTPVKQAIHYKAADGLDIEAYLTLPPNHADKKLPLIVLPHSGPTGRDGFALDWRVATFAAAGYAVLQPNYRGSSGYGQAFLAAGYGHWGDKMLTDLSDGVRYLAGQDTIDPRRVAIIGENTAGYLALEGSSTETTYTCAVSIAGLSDIEALMLMFGDTKSPVYKTFSRYFGDNANYAAISPIHRANNIAIPVLILAGEDQVGLPYQQSLRMADALKSAGKTVEFVKLSTTGNWRSEEAWRTEVMKPVLAFLAKYNPAN